MDTSNQPQAVPDLTKYILFDQHLRQLFTTLQNVLQSLHGTRIRIADEPIEFTCLNRYISIYNKMQPKEHASYYELAYARNRLGILAYPDVKWLRDGQVVIQLGEGTMKEIPASVRAVKILLSDIYKMALELKTKATENLSDVTANDPDLSLHDQVLLHLYRIFYVFAQVHDSSRVHVIVSTLEEKLKIPEDQRTPFRRADGQPPSGIFSLAIDMINRVVPVPQNIKDRLPSDGQVLGSIDTVLNHPTTQSVIGGVFGPLKDQLQSGQVNLGQAMGSVLENIQKPEMHAQMKGMLMQTIETSKQHGVSEEQVERMKRDTESFVQSMPAADMMLKALTTLPQHLSNTMAAQDQPLTAPTIYED